VGVAGSAQRVVSLLFADDINLVAHSADRMNHLLRLLAEFCSVFGMTVNVAKCELLVFHASPVLREGFAAMPIRYMGEALAVVARARYLGLHYGAGKPFSDCAVELLAAGRRATHALRSQLSASRVTQPRLVMQIYNACVSSVLSYGAQVWAPALLTSDFDRAMQDPMVKMQRAFMQHVVGAQKPPTRLLYAELSQMPLVSVTLHGGEVVYSWAGTVLRFWNTLVRQRGSLAHAAFCSDIALAHVAGRGVGWTYDVLRFLDTLEVRRPVGTPAEVVRYYSTLELPVPDLLGRMAGGLLRDWCDPELGDADPRMYQGRIGSTVCRYVHCMGGPVWDNGGLQPHTHTSRVVQPARHVALMRFRLCAWDLEVNRPRGRPRAERVCRFCARSGAHVAHVEDEQHVLMECPAYAKQRAASPFVFATDAGHHAMRELMSTDKVHELAALLHDIHVERSKVMQALRTAS
jgi:hypothetical protein